MMNFEIFIKVYSYRLEEGQIRQDHGLLIRVCDSSNLSTDRIFWMKEKFAALQGEKSMELTGLVLRDGGDKKEFTVTFSPPEKPYDDFWYLGVQLLPDAEIRFAIGNDKKYSFTEAVKLDFS